MKLLESRSESEQPGFSSQWWENPLPWYDYSDLFLNIHKIVVFE